MISAGLIGAIILWGQNNAATKYLAGYWPPVTIGVSRFLAAGLILLAVLHWTDWLGRSEAVSRELNRRLWRVSLFSLASYPPFGHSARVGADLGGTSAVDLAQPAELRGGSVRAGRSGDFGLAEFARTE